MSAHDHNTSQSLLFTRRQMLKTAAGAAAFAATGPLFSSLAAASELKLKGHIKHSACLGCYNAYMKREKMSLDQFAAACAKLGLKSIELSPPDQSGRR